MSITANALKTLKRNGYFSIAPEDLDEVEIRYLAKDWQRAMPSKDFLESTKKFIDQLLCDIGLGCVHHTIVGEQSLVVICKAVDYEVAHRALGTSMEQGVYSAKKRIS